MPRPTTMPARARLVELPARTILVAAGTQPNTVLGARGPGAFPPRRPLFPGDRRGRQRRSSRRRSWPSPRPSQVLTALRPDGRAISFFGDLHPSFSGNVVKAMGEREAGLSGGQPHARAHSPAGSNRRRRLPRPHRTTSCARPCSEVVPAHARPSSRSSCTRRMPRARFSPGQFYRLQNFETLAARDRRHPAGHGRPGADRRLGRPRAGPALDHRSGDGRVVRSLRAAEARRAGGPDGADRHAHRNAAGETVLLAGGGLGNAVLFSIGQALRAAGSQVLYFAGYKQDDRPLQGRRDRGGGRRRGLVLRRGARASRPAGRRTGPSSAISCEAMVAYRDAARWANQPIAARRGRPHHRHRLRRHDGRGRSGRATACSSRSQARRIRASARSTRRCNA